MLPQWLPIAMGRIGTDLSERSLMHDLVHHCLLPITLEANLRRSRRFNAPWRRGRRKGLFLS